MLPYRFHFRLCIDTFIFAHVHSESNVRNKLIRIANPNKDDYYKMLSRIVAHNSDNVLNKAIIFEFTYASVE